MNAGDWAQDCQGLFLGHFLGKIDAFLKPQNENSLYKISDRLCRALSETYNPMPNIPRPDES